SVRKQYGGGSCERLSFPKLQTQILSFERSAVVCNRGNLITRLVKGHRRKPLFGARENFLDRARRSVIYADPPCLVHRSLTVHRCWWGDLHFLPRVFVRRAKVQEHLEPLYRGRIPELSAHCSYLRSES